MLSSTVYLDFTSFSPTSWFVQDLAQHTLDLVIMFPYLLQSVTVPKSVAVVVVVVLTLMLFFKGFGSVFCRTSLSLGLSGVFS